MRNALITLMLATTMATGLATQAPAKPDFSGTWKLDPAASVVAPPPGAAGGVSQALLEPIVVKQTAETLSVTAKPGDDPFTFTYRLDGSTSKLAWPSGPGETVEATAVAKWDNDKLQIATSIPINGAVYKNTETWSITPNRLTIELVTSRGKQVRVYSIVRDREMSPSTGPRKWSGRLVSDNHISLPADLQSIHTSVLHVEEMVMTNPEPRRAVAIAQGDAIADAVEKAY